MKYPIALLTVLVLAFAVLLALHHWVIVPYVGPYGFVPMMGLCGIAGISVGTLTEHLVRYLHLHLRKNKP